MTKKPAPPNVDPVVAEHGAPVPQTGEARDEAALLDRLRDHHGGQANNGTLRSELRWKPERYWAARNRLMDRGIVQKAHGGPGGMTVIAAQPVAVSEETVEELIRDEGPISAETPQEVASFIKESELYLPVLREIETNWIADEGYDGSLVRITALLGSKDTGGKWSRPDISVVAIKKFKFLREPVFDIVTFELKPQGNITVEGVFEALSHRQSGTRAYAIYHISESDFKDVREGSRILALAEQHGVGVILAADPNNYDTWAERVPARRWNPDPEDMNEFIQRIFPPSDHDEIIKINK